MQRSFQFNHNYLTLFDANLKEYGIDPSDSNHKVHVNELYYSNFEKYKRKFVTKTPNDLTNWDRKRIIFHQTRVQSLNIRPQISVLESLKEIILDRIDDILYDPDDFKEFEENET